jgi:hypothetical protein
MVLPVAARLVEHLDYNVGLAKVGECEHEAGFKVVVARELLPYGVEVHLAARVKDHVHNPAAVAGSLPQMQQGLLVAGDEVGELVW